MKIRLGTDPEMFLRNKKSGRFVSAAGKFPGTKSEPHKLDKGAVQVDGLALEFNIDPADTCEEFCGNIETVLVQLDEMIAKVDPDLERVFTPYAEFDAKYFEDLGDEEKILGCDPDYNMLGKMNPSPSNIQNMPFRTAAGHIHIGWTEGKLAEDPAHFEDCRFLSEHFRYNFEPRTYRERMRLYYYGGGGAFRAKPYGVELRSPSNLWLATPDTRAGMYKTVMERMKPLVENATA